MYSLLLTIIYVAFISLGLPDSLLGAGWPVMHEAFNVPISYMGIITMIISGGTIISSLMSDALTKKLKTPTVTVVSVFLTATALLGFSLASEFWMLIAFAVPYGLGAGAIDAALNNYVAVHYHSRHMSWLHCFWGVGAIVSPFVMSYALTASAWNNGYRIISLIQMGIGLLLLFTLPIWKVNKSKNESNTDCKSIGLIGALKIKGVPSLLLGFFAYCAAESTAMGWASTYLVEVKNIAEEKAAAFASLFFIGLTAGRFIGGFFTDKLGDRKMIIFGTIIAIFGIACLLTPTSSETLALIGFIIFGLGCAPIYPCIIHSTPNNFGEENCGAIIGIQMASAYMGSTFMPPLYGLLGRLIGFEIMPVYLIAFILLMIVMTEKTSQMCLSKKEDTQQV